MSKEYNRKIQINYVYIMLYKLYEIKNKYILKPLQNSGLYSLKTTIFTLYRFMILRNLMIKIDNSFLFLSFRYFCTIFVKL